MRDLGVPLVTARFSAGGEESGEAKRASGEGILEDRSEGDVATFEDSVNRRIRDSYRRLMRAGRWPEGLKTEWPIQYSWLPRRTVVFVGINPSEARSFPFASVRDLSDRRVLRAVLDHDRACLGRTAGKEAYAYYQPFSQLAPDAWAHVDLLPVREKSQTRMRSVLGLERKKRVERHPAVATWLELAFEIIEQLEPRAIVVVNAFASELVNEHAASRWSLKWDELRGWRHAKVAGRIVPVLFSGMITGQRALDRHSRERLAWQVKQACRFQGEPVGPEDAAVRGGSRVTSRSADA